MDNNRPFFCAFCGARANAADIVCARCGKKLIRPGYVSADTADINMPIPDVRYPEPRRQSGGMVALTAVLSVFLCFFVLTAGLLVGIRRQLSPDGTERMLDEIEPYDLVDRALSENGTNAEDVLNRAVSKSIAQRSQFTEKGIRKILNSGKTKSFVASKLNDYVEDFLHDTGTGRLRASEITRLIRSYDNYMADYFDLYPTERDYEELETALKNLDLDRYSAENIRSSMPGAFGAARVLLSNGMLIAVIAGAVLLTAAILLINLRYIAVFLRAEGAALTAAGALLIAVRAAVGLSLPAVLGEWSWMADTANRCLSVLYSGLLLFGLIALIVGVLLCVASAVVSSMKRGSQKQPEYGMP